jgi:hypothetical protein
MPKLLLSLDFQREKILRKAAKDLDVSVSEFVRRLLDEHVVFDKDGATKLKSTIRRRDDEDVHTTPEK